MTTFKQFLADSVYGRTGPLLNAWHDKNIEEKHPALREKMEAFVAATNKQLSPKDMTIWEPSSFGAPTPDVKLIQIHITPKKAMLADEYSLFFSMVKSLVKHHIGFPLQDRALIYWGNGQVCPFGQYLEKMSDTQKTSKTLEIKVIVPA